MATVTCHTPGCENDGVPIELDHPLTMNDETGVADGPPVDPWVIECGPCGQPITDVVEDGGPAPAPK